MSDIVAINRAWCGSFTHSRHVEFFERAATTSERQNWFNLVKNYGGTDEEATAIVRSMTSLQGPKLAANAMQSRTGEPAKTFLTALEKHGWPA